MSDAFAYAKRLFPKTANGKLLLFVLWEHIDERGFGRPSSKRLSIDSGKSQRTISATLDALEEEGFIRRRRVYDGANGRRGADEIELVGFVDWRDALDAKAAPDKPSQMQRMHVQDQHVQPLHLKPEEADDPQNLGPKSQQPASPIHASSAREILASIVHREKNKNISARKSGMAERKTKISQALMMTDEWRAYAGRHGFLNGTCDRLFEDFKDYHTARGTLNLDWSAAWRMWVRKRIEIKGPPAPEPGAPRGPAVADWPKRLAYFREKGQWLERWGPPPGHEGYLGPQESTQ